MCVVCVCVCVCVCMCVRSICMYIPMTLIGVVLQSGEVLHGDGKENILLGTTFIIMLHHALSK